MNHTEQLSLFEQAQKHDLFRDIQPHIVERFWKFHQENPHVYEWFKAFSHDVKNSGAQGYGSKAVVERIRWHVMIETKGEPFKISNDFTACYSRLLIMLEPAFEGFFQLRGRAA